MKRLNLPWAHEQVIAVAAETGVAIDTIRKWLKGEFITNTSLARITLGARKLGIALPPGLEKNAK